MTIDQEPPAKKRRKPVHGNLWKTDQITGHRTISSGPVPKEKELPSQDGTGLVTRVEGAPESPAFPGTPRVNVPSKGARLDD